MLTSSLLVIVTLLVCVMRRRRRHRMPPSEAYRAHVRTLEKQKKRAVEKTQMQTRYNNPNLNYHLQIEPYAEFASCDAGPHSYPPSYATITERPPLPKAAYIPKPKWDNARINTRVRE